MALLLDTCQVMPQICELSLLELKIPEKAYLLFVINYLEQLQLMSAEHSTTG